LFLPRIKTKSEAQNYIHVKNVHFFNFEITSFCNSSRFRTYFAKTHIMRELRILLFTKLKGLFIDQTSWSILKFAYPSSLYFINTSLATLPKLSCHYWGSQVTKWVWPIQRHTNKSVKNCVKTHQLSRWVFFSQEKIPNCQLMKI